MSDMIAARAKADFAAPPPPGVLLIEYRALVREALASTLRAQLDRRIWAYPTIDEWIGAKLETTLGLVILSTLGCEPDSIDSEIPHVLAMAGGIPCAILSDCENPKTIANALRVGAKGYIPTSLPLAVWIEALRLIQAGGVYGPISALLGNSVQEQHRAEPSNGAGDYRSQFTPRQLDVIEALRRGKSNKLIAYELQMCEGTVKVHIRNIMRKLKATNRTEVAILANQFLK
ncbi:MAG: response regulator transcription factor [Hyphomicrobiaceae bacterium]|nr:response regulator transcription factor [Hyphomicrobiaceae bacterium]